MMQQIPLTKHLAQADELFRSRKYEDARLLYLQILESPEADSATGSDVEIRIEAMAQVARSYLILDEKEEGRNWLTRTAEVVDGEKQPSAWSRYLGVRGRFEWKDDDLARATSTFKMMYEFCRENELYERAVDAAHMVAITAPHEEQIFWAKRGIEAAEEGNMTGWLGPLWNNLGWSYDEMGEHDEALNALLKAREFHYSGKRDVPKLVADYSVGVQYRKLKNIEKALQWMKPAAEWADRLYAAEASVDHAEWVGWTHKELGEIAVLEGDGNQAKREYGVALEKLREAKMPDWDAEGFGKIEQKLADLGSVSGS